MTQIADITLNEWMSRGGDARITLDRETGLNRYFSAPFPRDVLAFASSTANDLSDEADAFLRQRFPDGAEALENGEAYTQCLEMLRGEIRQAYRLSPGIDIFFAPSGTDLEYVGLLAVAGRKSGGIVNHLLGADEVGSGCIHSAAGHYFADETAPGAKVSTGLPVAGLPPISMDDSPVRCQQGTAHESDFLTASLELSIAAALKQDRFPLIHIVHGSKTGLVLPHLDDVDRLRARFGQHVAFVVDACQARITDDAIEAYLKRGIIVFITGSKFMGGPPFSGFALIPPGIASNAAPLAEGMANIFKHAEVPESWPGREICENSGNPGLALRLSASLFELSRFQDLGLQRASRVVHAFTIATDELAQTLGVRKVASAPAGDARGPVENPIEMLTLVTLDLCNTRDGQHKRSMTFEDAALTHKALVEKGIRLGQPVRCVRRADGQWGATLRIGLSMPQITRLDSLGDDALRDWLRGAMDKIATGLAPHLSA
ncbi:MAG: hypothetical protein KUG65_02800 [Sphingomonadaceae bacterium]|nr:hypothetical protein [Sphingomonadaceae bacterium]